MGVCCGANDMGDDSILRDMAAPDLTGVKDAYKRWELSQPFARTPFYAFKNAVEEA